MIPDHIMIGDSSSHLNRYLSENNYSKICILVDENTHSNCLKKIEGDINFDYDIFKIDSGEEEKNLATCSKVWNFLTENLYDRKSLIINLGGGVICDMGGFVASTFKRGIDFINIPTTLLAQVDSSIGGKTGVNTKIGKNLLGSFYQPNLVLTDVNFLRTLPKREIICGYAEILKHSLILDKKFFLFLDKNSKQILNLNNLLVQKAIYKSCLIKKKIVEKDEKEKSLRKILNFGHTFGHAFESTMAYSKKLNHGEAVILGMSSALKFSLNKNLIKKKEYEYIINHINKNKLPNKVKNYFSIKDLNKILFFMTKDKKNTSNKINLILLKKIGSTIINQNYRINDLKSFLKKELTN